MLPTVCLPPSKLQTLEPSLSFQYKLNSSRMTTGTQRDVEYKQMSLNACVLLDGLWPMAVLITTHYSSPGPSASQSVGRRCVNTFFWVDRYWSKTILEQHSNRRVARKAIHWTIRAMCCGDRFVFINKLQFLDAS